MATTAPATLPFQLHGLPVITTQHARILGMTSITMSIDSGYEDHILAGVAQHRDPQRAAFVPTGKNKYQLHVLRADISNLAD